MAVRVVVERRCSGANGLDPGVNTTFTASYATPDPPVQREGQLPAGGRTTRHRHSLIRVPCTGATNGYTYGWNADTSANAFDRNAKASLDPRYDTFVLMQHFTDIGSGNCGSQRGYSVRIVAGDAKAHNACIASRPKACSLQPELRQLRIGGLKAPRP